MKKHFNIIKKWISLYWGFLILSLIIAILLLILIYAGNKIKEWEWSPEVISALLGAAVVTAITYVLLKGQANSESDVEQMKRVFECRIKAYESFLDVLREVIIKNEVTSEDEKRLQFGVAVIGMHTSSNEMLRLSKNLKKIVQKIRLNEVVDGSIWFEIIDIVQLFHYSLYKEDVTEMNSEMKKAIRNFRGICADENKELLEYLESWLSQFNFDTHIAENCLFINIHIREEVYKTLKSKTGLKNSTPYRLYITLQIENSEDNKYNGRIAIYSGKDRSKQKVMIETIYNNFWKDHDPERNKTDFMFEGLPFWMGSMNIKYAYLLRFNNKIKEELQAIIILILKNISALWDEPGNEYICLVWNEKTKKWERKPECFTPIIEN